MIYAHDRKTGTERVALRGCSQGVLRLAISPDGKEVAAAVGDLLGSGVIHRFDVGLLEADMWRSPAPQGRISYVGALSPDGSRFAACDFNVFDDRPESHNYVMRNLVDGTEQTLKLNRRWFRGAYALDGRLFVPERESVRDKQEAIRMIDADGKLGQLVKHPSVAIKEQFLAAISCTPDGRTLSVVAGDFVEGKQVLARLQTLDTDSHKLRVTGEVDLTDVFPAKTRFPTIYPLGSATDRDGSRLATAFTVMWENNERFMESRGVLVVWDLVTGKVVFRKQTTASLHAAAFNAKGKCSSQAEAQVVAWCMAGTLPRAPRFSNSKATRDQFSRSHLARRGDWRPGVQIAL